MSKRRDHDAAFKARVALETVKEGAWCWNRRPLMCPSDDDPSMDAVFAGGDCGHL